jgi:hypothetical protein
MPSKVFIYKQTALMGRVSDLNPKYDAPASQSRMHPDNLPSKFVTDDPSVTTPRRKLQVLPPNCRPWYLKRSRKLI